MENLFADFPAATAAQWKARIAKDLKGITFDQLTCTDRNGLQVCPFYTSEDLPKAPQPTIAQNDWAILASIDVDEPASANKKALLQLDNGASGLSFVLHSDAEPDILLHEIELPYIYAQFKVKGSVAKWEEKLAAHIRKQGWHIASGQLVVTPYQADSTESYVDSLGNLSIDASAFQNAGAASTYELACTLALLSEHLHKLDKQGALTATKSIQICLAADTLFFEQIAKLRALRQLVPIVTEVFGINPGFHLQVVTSNIYRSPFDAYNNLLRDTIAGMAAVIGGCDSLFIAPFDEFLNGGNDIGTRLGRNQQLLFKEESYLDKIADAAAGSYYLENLTEAIARKALDIFKEIEKAGGFWQILPEIQGQIKAQKEELVAAYKNGEKVLIGVNKFPNPKDEPRKGEQKAHTVVFGLQPLYLWEEVL
ncbi:MAG: methylmalonyl-CoA mutase family protein [Edaphocola sp.]